MRKREQSWKTPRLLLLSEDATAME